jgi:hypothetical protein
MVSYLEIILEGVFSSSSSSLLILPQIYRMGLGGSITTWLLSGLWSKQVMLFVIFRFRQIGILARGSFNLAILSNDPIHTLNASTESTSVMFVGLSANSTFISEQINHQQPINSTFSQNKSAPATNKTNRLFNSSLQLLHQLNYYGWWCPLKNRKSFTSVFCSMPSLHR